MPFKGIAQNISPQEECLTGKDGGSLSIQGGFTIKQSGFCTPNSPVFQNFMKYQNNFIPSPNVWTQSPTQGNTTPETVVKKLKVRFIVVGDTLNPNKMNFRREDTPALKQLVESLNDSLKHLRKPNYPMDSICGTCWIKDERLRVQLTDITFVQDVTEFRCHVDSNLLNHSGIVQTKGKIADTLMKQYGKGTDSILNVFIYFDTSAFNPDVSFFWPGAWANGLPNNYKGPFTKKPRAIFMFNDYIYHKQQRKPIMKFMEKQAVHFMHEIHHLLGLCHLQNNCNAPGQKDYLADAFPFKYPRDSAVDTVYNVMNDLHWQDYVTPLQMGRVHRNCFMASISKYVYPTEQPNKHQWIVDTSQTWDFPIRMFQDIVVKEGVRLTLKCRMQMPSYGRIIVEKGGTLIIDGGTITSYNPLRTWGGIELEGDPNSPPDSAHQGRVILKNHRYSGVISYGSGGGSIPNSNVHFPTIKRAKSGIRNFIGVPLRTYSGKIYGEGGGIIQSEDARFINCERAVELVNYEQFSYWPGYPNDHSKCYFHKTTFKRTDPAISVYHTGTFTSFKVKGIEVVDNHFINEVPFDSISHLMRGTGIHYEASQGLIAENKFEGFSRGVDNMGFMGSPSRVVFINKNHFNHNCQSITLAGATENEVRGNTFENMYAAGMGLMDTSGDLQYLQKGYAVLMDNTRQSYVGCQNLIYGESDLDTVPFVDPGSRYGVVATNTNGNPNFVYDNTFNNMHVGVQTQQNNPSLYIYGNRFNENYMAWAVNPDPAYQSGQYILNHQGTGCYNPGVRAHDTFINNTVDIHSYLNNTWTYFAWDDHDAPDSNKTFGSVHVVQCNLPGSNNEDPTNPMAPPLNIAPCRITAYSEAVLDSLITVYNGFDPTDVPRASYKDLVFGQIIRGFNALDDMDGLEAFLEGQETDEARKMLIPFYIERGKYQKVNPLIYALNVSKKERKGYLDYYGLLSHLFESGRSVYDLTPDEHQEVAQIAEDSLEVSAYAKGLLSIAFDEPWHHYIADLPIETDVYRQENNGDKTIGSRLEDAVPNPAREGVEITVLVSPGDAALSPNLVIYNLKGQQVFRQSLKAGQNRIQITTENWTPGIYVYGQTT